MTYYQSANNKFSDGLLNRPAGSSLSRSRSIAATAAGVARSEKSLPTTAGGPYSALDQLAASHLLNALAHPLLAQQVAVVKEGGKHLAPAP